MIANIIAVVVLVAVLGGAASYVYRAKKRGVKCVGCPYGGECGSKSCSCGDTEKSDEK